jgi:hypothetical protein
MTDKYCQKDVLSSKDNVESKCEVKMGPFYLKNKDGIDFRYFRKCRHFETISFQLGVVKYRQLPSFILI